MSVLLNVPQTASAGDIVEVKILISHPMETGFRTGPDGKLVPRNIIHDLRCLYQGVEVFRVEMFPAITANPYFGFRLRATATGPVTLTWTDEDGIAYRESRDMTVV